MKPVLQALVLADRVYQDVTGKKIIAGTFTTWSFSRKVPVVAMQHPDGTTRHGVVGGMRSGSPYVYVSLTDVCEDTKILLQFVNLTKNAVIFGTEGVITQVKRLSPVELVFPLPELQIDEAGTYAIELVCEGEILGSWRITAIDLDQQKQEEEHANGD